MERRQPLAHLTPEQAALMPVVRDEWISRALGGDTSIDRAQTREAIDWVYRKSGNEPPPLLIVVDSPMGMQLAANCVKHLFDSSVRASVRDSVGDSVGASVWDSVGASVWESVRESVGDSVWDSVWESVRESVGESVGDSVRESVWASVWDSVGASVWASVWESVRESVGDSVWESVRESVGASVGDSVRESVWASVGESVRESVRDSVGESVGESIKAAGLEWFRWGCYGGMGWDAGWMAWADYFQRIGVLDHEAFRAFRRLADAGVWDTIWLKGAPIVCRRPRIVRKELAGDFRARLHSLKGPSTEWADGFATHHLAGMRVPGEWIEKPESITVEQVLAEDNVELRRALITLMGMERFAGEAKAEVIDADADLAGMPRRLLRIPQQGDEVIVLVEVRCPSTGKVAHLRVPPTMERCSQAVAWTFGFEVPAEYRPVVEA